MTKICCISDTHGHLPLIPQCDLLIHAGDICPIYDHSVGFQERWILDNFIPWLRSSAEEAVFIAGNHDFFFQRIGHQLKDHWSTIPEMYVNKQKVHYLQDWSTTINGLKIFGTPWQPYFGGWAFNLYENDLLEKWSKIPSDTDILVIHGPPFYVGDYCPNSSRTGWEHVGSPSLRKRIEDIQPKLVVCGHIHPGYGRFEIGKTIVLNASYLNEGYEPQNEIMVIDL